MDGEHFWAAMASVCVGQRKGLRRIEDDLRKKPRRTRARTEGKWSGRLSLPGLPEGNRTEIRSPSPNPPVHVRHLEPIGAHVATTAWLAVTKLTAPARRHDALTRERLNDAIERSLADSRLTLISAPAGAGKTTLLAELPGRFANYRFCWLLLDEEDNDPSRFTSALIASLQTASVLTRDEDPAPNDPRLLITFLINRLTERPAENCVLVLDDLHVITEQAVHDVLAYLLDHAPANLRLIVATRHDPPMSLARRRGRSEVSEIRLDDLNFTEDEAGELASRCLGVSFSRDEVRLLHSRTDGWAAGLRLLTTSLRQFPGNRALLQGGTLDSRQIFDFLAEEVLDRQPPDLRRFLLETSILSRLRPDVCDALTGRQDSRALLEDLYHRNLYVADANRAESTYRYHDLFADFLREHLRRERPGDWQALQVRAARAESAPQDRIRHLLAAEAWEEAAEEIERVGPELTMRGFVATLSRWIRELPEEVQTRHPRILYLLGQAVWILKDFSEAQPCIERALDGFRRLNDHAGQAEATIALANSALTLNQLERCRDLLKEALTYDIPAAGRIQLHTASGWEAIFRRDLNEAMGHIDQVFLMVENGDGRTSPMSLLTVLYSQGIAGYIGRMEAMCRTLLEQLSGPEGFSHAIYHVLNSSVLANRGDVKTAESEAERSMSIARACGEVSLIKAALHVNFCLISASRGDWQSVDRWATLGGDESRHGHIARAWKLAFLYFQARARWHGDSIELLRQTHEAAMAPNPFEAPPVVVYRGLIEGTLRLAERSYAQAERAFRDALRDETEFQITRANCSARVLLAYTLLSRGRSDDAIEIFSPYLRECEDDNIPGRLLFETPLSQPLLRLAAERDVQPHFAGKVLAMMGAPPKAAEAEGGEALTVREMEVLRAMAEGISNRAIGERLFVSESTVKTHVQRIFRKLDSVSRTQAVTRARGLMLI